MNSVVGPHYKAEDFHLIDLSITNEALQVLDNQDELMSYILEQTTVAKKQVAYGGYKEERDFYLKSPLFSGERRTLHLGVDVWLPVHTPVYAARDGVVFGKAYNQAYLDYGYTIVLQHEVDGAVLHALYGHLSEKDFEVIQVGQTVEANQVIAYVGDESENGGWAPHLHFQLIKDMEGNLSDYPGVCQKNLEEQYCLNCPDPISWII